jgi:hypothetical protein
MSLARDARDAGAQVRPAEVNGQAGALYLDAVVQSSRVGHDHDLPPMASRHLRSDMAVPEFVRYIAAFVGLVIVGTAARSVIGTVIVPRAVATWLTGLIDKTVNAIFRMLTDHVHDFHRRDRLLAAQAPALLITQLGVWLTMFFLGFSLLFWPLIPGGVTTAFGDAGPAIWAVGDATAHGALQRAILDFAALFALITVTLQISYLPTLYSAFNRRETEVALLNSRAGVPSWGPELLARTHYALGSGVSSINTLPDIYADWERWAADVTESHTTYLPLVRFRSPKPLSSWVTALLAVLDSAAMFLALSPGEAPVVAARLCLRSGFLCFNDIARTMGYHIPQEADPSQGISITYAEWLEAIERLREVDFPIERDPAEAWPDFVGWRVNYEAGAYAIGLAVDAVPALWSGPRHPPVPPIPPIRPSRGRPPNGQETNEHSVDAEGKATFRVRAPHSGKAARQQAGRPVGDQPEATPPATSTTPTAPPVGQPEASQPTDGQPGGGQPSSGRPEDGGDPPSGHHRPGRRPASDC